MHLQWAMYVGDWRLIDLAEAEGAGQKLIATFFEEYEKQSNCLARVCAVLTESILLEQGISSQVMKAEQVKHKLNQGHELNELFSKTSNNLENTKLILPG